MGAKEQYDPDSVGADAFVAGDLVAERFEVERLVKVGGMGTVYRARDLASRHQPVALKIIAHGRRDTGKPASASGEVQPKTDEVLASFEQEAELLSNLRHPAIVRYLCHGSSDGGEPYLALEWVEGRDLSARLKQAPLSVSETLRLGRRIAEGLAAAHRVGVIHRDVKPGNILLPDDDVDQAKLADFGIAQFTHYGLSGGTPRYMAPEQKWGYADIDARADVYALGLVLIRCLVDPSWRREERRTTPNAAATEGAAEDAISQELVRKLRSDVPTELDALLCRMIAVNRNARPANAGVVASTLQDIFAKLHEKGSWVMSDQEQRLVGILAVTYDDPAAFDPEPLFERLADFDSEIHRRTDEIVTITLRASVAAGDHPVRVARCALALRKDLPRLRLGLVLGRAAARGVEPLADRAIELLGRTAELGSVLLDEDAARLLDARFEIGEVNGAPTLVDERPAATRMLLGRPSPWVGRTTELSLLKASFEQCVTLAKAGALLLTGVPGVGKSRLVREFLLDVQKTAFAPQVWVGRGDAVSSGSPFALLTQLVADAVGFADGEPLEARQKKLHDRLSRTLRGSELSRVEVFLGEIVRAPYPADFSLALLVARQDPQLMAEQARRAWLQFVGACCSERPLVLVIDDLQWCDLASVRFIGDALAGPEGRGLFVLAMGRPEALTRFPGLRSASNVEHLSLDGLSEQESESFVCAVIGESAPSDAVRKIVRRAEGNPLHLEELIRAVEQGDPARPGDTVLSMVASRLQSLEFEARLLLRAASVFGEHFWIGGVAHLRRGAESTAMVREWLDQLVRHELVLPRRSSRFPGEHEYEFHHGAVREAAYAMLTEEDAATAHREVGQWLKERGESDAYVLAEHFRLGRDAEEATKWYARAAEQAFQRNEFDAVVTIAERGLACGTSSPHVGMLELLCAEVKGCLGQHEQAAELARRAMTHLPSDTPNWYSAAGEAALASARIGDRDQVVAIIGQLGRIEPSSGGSVEFTGLIRAALPLASSGKPDMADDLLKRIERATQAMAERDRAALGPLYSARALRAVCAGDLGAGFHAMEAAKRAFEEAGSLRNAWEHQAGAGFLGLELGRLEHAEQLLSELIERTAEVGLWHVNAVAKHNLGRRIAEAGRVQEGRRLESEALEAFRAHNNRRMEGLTHSHLAGIELIAGRLPEAEEHARRAVAILEDEAASKLLALATLARTLLARGALSEALTIARQAHRGLSSVGRLQEGEALVRLTHAEALWAGGLQQEARERIREARDQLLARAAKLDHPDLVESFLTQVPENAATLDHARRWLTRPST